jgi:hypothetical protein
MLVKKRQNVMCALIIVGMVSIHCHRSVEPFEEQEKVEEPDLSQIFPSRMDANDGQRGVIDLAALPDPAPTTGFDPAIRGEIRLSNDVTVPEGAVLFLIARGPSAGSAPTAVKRFTDPVFPQAFRIGPEDRMLQNTDFSGPFTLTARLDQDGNATTKGAIDLIGKFDHAVPVGTRGILINLKHNISGP